jgi:cytoskeletal protein RodZ
MCALQALVSWQLKLRESGPSFDFKHTKAKEEAKGNREEKHSSWWLGASFLAIAVVLILFSVAFVVSIRQILCNPGRSLLPGN